MNNEKENFETQKDVSDEEQIEIQESTDEIEIVKTTGLSKISVPKMIFASVVGVLLIGVIGFAVWRILVQGGDEGKPVPAPRNTAFDDSGSGGNFVSGERKITLTDEQLAAADLKIVRVGETLDAVAMESTTTGVIKANEYRETPVISQVGGVVKSIDANLGQYVRKGQTVAIVASQELADTQSKYLSMKAELNESEKRYRRALNLSKISEESRNELDKTTADLKTAEAEHIRHLSHYRRTEKLVEIGAKSRDEFEAVRAMHKTATAKLEEAKRRFARAKQLLRINPARKNEIDRFLTKVRNQQSDIASVRERLLVLGLSRRKVNSLSSPRQISSNLPIRSPISGTITERIANQNEVVSVNGKLATITDLSVVWVIGQIYEKDLGKLRVGSGASVMSDAYPGELIRGQISYIDPNLDEKTRTASVRIEIPNPDQKLKIGQYVKVGYARIGGASEKTTPLVPKDAVQPIGNQKIVFEPTDDPNTFILRPLILGQERENAYPAVEGIFVGDKVVTGGSFLLRAEFLKSNPKGDQF